MIDNIAKTTNFEGVLVLEGDPLRRVLEVIQASGLGICLVVDSDRKLKGTITDGDCRRALLRNSPLDTPAGDFMSRQFILVDETFSKEAVKVLMKVNSVRQIPVVDRDGRVSGILTERSMLRQSERTTNLAVILAGGQGQRLRPLTSILPKPMLPVAGRPLIEHLVARLVGSGFHEIYMSLNYKGSVVAEHFKNSERFGCSIKFIDEQEPLGTAGCLSLIREKIVEPVVVANGDVLTGIDFRAFIDFHTANQFDMTVGTSTSGIQVPFGVIKTNENGEITEIEEKPVHKLMVNAGLYVISPQVIKLLPESGFFQMTELIQAATAAKMRVGVFPIHEIWLDVGQPAQYAEAQTTAGRFRDNDSNAVAKTPITEKKQ